MNGLWLVVRVATSEGWQEVDPIYLNRGDRMTVNDADGAVVEVVALDEQAVAQPAPKTEGTNQL